MKEDTALAMCIGILFFCWTSLYFGPVIIAGPVIIPFSNNDWTKTAEKNYNLHS
jgi:hypothetical protein